MTQITDLQVFTVCLSIVIPLSMLLYSNSRINDAKETLRAELTLVRTEMKAGFEQISAQLKIHEMEHHHK